MSLPYLNIYAQEEWHAEASIVANRDGLLRLRAAIDAALDVGVGVLDAYAGDGEGYSAVVVRLDDADAMGKMAVPYTDPDAGETWRENVAVWPWDVPGVKEAHAAHVARANGDPA